MKILATKPTKSPIIPPPTATRQSFLLKFSFISISTRLFTFLKLLSFSFVKYSLENILERIPRKLVSRTSVKNILDEAVTQEFYFKALDNKDNRRRVYSINSKYEGEIIGLMARYQDIFGELRRT